MFSKIKSFLALIVLFLALAGCQKEDHLRSPQLGGSNDNGGFITPQLFFSAGDQTKSTGNNKSEIQSGQTISGDVAYFFRFWLTPEGSLGEFVIRNSFGQIIFLEQGKTQFEIKFQETGTYDLEVISILVGNEFLFDDITIVVTDGQEEPETIDVPATKPVVLSNLFVNGSTASVDVAICKKEYSNQLASDWFFVSLIGGDFSTRNNLNSNSCLDSVRFTLQFPAVNQTKVEFNAAFEDESTGGVWLTAGAGNPASILFDQTNGSGNFFSFRFHVNGSEAEIRTLTGTLVLSTSGVEEAIIPGEDGDGPATNYQVRWTGLNQFFKTEITSPTFRFRIGLEGEFTEMPLTLFPENNDFVQVTLPSSVSGSQVRMQIGTGTGENFVPSSEMENSQYACQLSGETEIVVNT
jgi:hypothetical protein